MRCICPFPGLTSIELSLNQNFFCFLALIIHRRQLQGTPRFNLKMDFTYNLSMITLSLHLSDDDNGSDDDCNELIKSSDYNIFFKF